MTLCVRFFKYLIQNGAQGKDRKYLLHDAVLANYENLDKVLLLIHSAKVDPSQCNEERMTLVHIAADGKPPRIDLLVLALEEGVNPNIQDNSGDTALHKVTTNYTERMVPWKESEKAMKILLQDPKTKPNIPNAQGLTPLAILTKARGTLPVSLLWMWLEKEADFTGGGVEAGLSTSPLAEISRRPDGHILINTLIRRLGVGTLNSYFKCMLEAAVEKGSAGTVKVLLENGASANEGDGRLLMLAARSKYYPDLKLRYLKEFGANPNYRDQRGFSVLHAVAQADSTEKVLRACTNAQLLHLGLDLVDFNGNTPLHVAARSKHSCSEMFFGKVAGREVRGNPNALNILKETPLQLVLRNNHSNKELRRNKVMLLLLNGCKPRLEDFSNYEGDSEDFQKLFLSTDVITKSTEPFRFLLVLAHYCKERLKNELAKHSDSHLPDWTSLQWRNLNGIIEDKAIMVIEELGKGTKFVGWGMKVNDYFRTVNGLGWNKFLANENVGKILERQFYGQLDMYNAEEKGGKNTLHPDSWRTLYLLPWHMFIFLLQCNLLPFYILIMACCRKTDCGTILKMLYVDPRKLPIVTFYSSMVSYMVFLGLLIVHIVKDSPDKSFQWFDWVLLLYVAAMVVEEIYQIVIHKSRYLSITNGCDVTMIACFCTFFLIRLFGNTTGSYTSLRISEHVFAVAVALSFLRLLYYMQVNHKLGPILFSFKAIWSEVVSFVSILGIVLVAFGTAMTAVYNAGVYTADFRNGTITLPPLVSGLWPTLQMMYWSLYGQVDYEDLYREALHPESVFGLVLFALWSLVSIIVLLNMLIALIDEAFDRVKKQNADLVWNLAVNSIITDIERSPSFPLPMNLFYITASFLGIKWLKSLFEEKRPSKGKPQSEEVGKIKHWLEEEKSKEKRTAQNVESAGSLEVQISDLKMELSRGMKTLRCQTKERLNRVHSWLRKQRSQPADNKGNNSVDGHFRMSKTKSSVAAEQDSESESDSDVDEDDQGQVRHERVDYHEEPKSATISYKGTNGKIGCCHFLNKHMSETLQYFEVRVLDYGRSGSIVVGLAHRSYPLRRMPGLSKGSVAYHCAKGQILYEHGSGNMMASPTQQNDVIGCGIRSYPSRNGDEDSAVVFFTRNGEELGSKEVMLAKTGLFPIVSLRSEGERVEVNWNAEWKSTEDVYVDTSDLDHQSVRKDQNLEIGKGKKSSRLEDINEFEALSSTSDSLISANDIGDSQLTHDLAVHSADVFPLVTVLQPGATLHATHQMSTQISDPTRSERVYVTGNLLTYGSDDLSRVGVYQSLLPLRPESSYYEVTVKDYGLSGTIGVGLARHNYPLNQQPGLKSGSIGWHCGDGGLYIERGYAIAKYAPGIAGDIIGCGIDFASSTLFSGELGGSHSGERKDNKVEVFFTLNGKRIIEETIKEPEGGFYPTVGLQSPGEMVEINLSAVSLSTPTLKRGALAERVQIDGNVVSFVSNPYDNPCNDVGGIQLMQFNMEKLRYFDVTILSGGEESAIGIGVASSKYPLDNQPGWGNESIAYHCNTGFCFSNGESESFRVSSSAKDIIGCGIRHMENKVQVFFTRNGKKMGVPKSFERLEPSELYPIVCMNSPGEKVKINVKAIYDEDCEEPLFSRWERIEIEGNKASYDPDEYMKVGTVQLSREISEENPYFEVEVTSFGEEGRIGVGLTWSDYPLDCEPGWCPGSVGYHCDDGCLFEGVSWRGTPVHKPGSQGDRIGCGIKYSGKKGAEVTVVFFHNGKEVCRSELTRSRDYRLFPTIGMQSRGEAITVIKNAKWPKQDSLDMWSRKQAMQVTHL
jgi:ankyrin repeat protein